MPKVKVLDGTISRALFDPNNGLGTQHNPSDYLCKPLRSKRKRSAQRYEVDRLKAEQFADGKWAWNTLTTNQQRVYTRDIKPERLNARAQKIKQGILPIPKVIDSDLRDALNRVGFSLPRAKAKAKRKRRIDWQYR